jgi:fatty acid desaturase
MATRDHFPPRESAAPRVVHARRPTPEERARELLALERQFTREERLATARTIGACFLWLVLGLYLLGLSVHLTDKRYAYTAFWAGLLVGNGGILFSLVMAWFRTIDD